jgi:hypothetical protein
MVLVRKRTILTINNIFQSLTFNNTAFCNKNVVTLLLKLCNRTIIYSFSRILPQYPLIFISISEYLNTENTLRNKTTLTGLNLRYSAESILSKQLAKLRKTRNKSFGYDLYILITNIKIMLVYIQKSDWCLFPSLLSSLLFHCPQKHNGMISIEISYAFEGLSIISVK